MPIDLRKPVEFGQRGVAPLRESLSEGLQISVPVCHLLVENCLLVSGDQAGTLEEIQPIQQVLFVDCVLRIQDAEAANPLLGWSIVLLEAYEYLLDVQND